MDLPGYDEWKLATPPEYEWEDGEEDADRAEDDWLDLLSQEEAAQRG